MSKHRTGLHKEISVIFDGVPIPGKNGAQQPSDVPTPDCTDHVPPEPPASDQLTSPMPKTQEPTQPPPEAAPPKQPEDARPQQPEVAQPKQPEADAAPKIVKQALWQQVWQQIENKLFTPKSGVSATKQKVIVIPVLVLLIILIFVLTQALSTSPQKTNEPWSFEPTNAAAGSNIEIDWQIPEPYPATLRDPTQFGRGTTAQSEIDKPDELIVKAIVYSKDNACAMINGQILYEGDQVSGAIIVKINKRSIEFEMNGKKWTQKVQ